MMWWEILVEMKRLADFERSPLSEKSLQRCKEIRDYDASASVSSYGLSANNDNICGICFVDISLILFSCETCFSCSYE